ncbi:hypothetical protein B0A50_00125 [Salinomyces thailandicus]|uniref:Uncharacterized protein n=1 Tax=Salinomyces thailandicus TaxID=706561 RepID=A0A4U0UHU4_9PEZI|nr:hypothetical protein B0A50_00125 [Salinomyces thailandica]
MSTRTRLSYNINLNPTTNFTIHIADPSSITADNLALATWGSAEVLANTLHKLPDIHLSPRTSPSEQATNTNDDAPLISVLELGAGTGIAGLAAACIWRTPVILTDLPLLVPNLQANIELNNDLLAKHSGLAHSGTLDWSEPSILHLTGSSQTTTTAAGQQTQRARVLLAADTVYSDEHPPLLTQTIVARLELSALARVVLCYPLRIGYLDHIRALWEALEEAGLSSRAEGRERVDESWEEDVEYEWVVWGWSSEKLRA